MSRRAIHRTPPVIVPTAYAARAASTPGMAAKASHRPARSQFLIPHLTDCLLGYAHRKMGVDYSLGGYLEDRRDVWRGSYLNPESAVHVAIDVNVPAGTPVCLTRPARVARMDHDPEQNGGWGGVIMFALDQPVGNISHFLYAHLSRQGLKVKEGDAVRPGVTVGQIGLPDENGGWYEHIHIQAFTRQAWDKFGGELKNFDGYAPDPRAAAHPYFPDPMKLLVKA